MTKKYRFPHISYIFCDINLDYIKEGFDIVKLHKKRKLKSKIIAFTAENYSKELIQNLGFDDFLNKDFSNVDLFFKNKVFRSIDKKQPFVNSNPNLNIRC